MNWSLEKGRDEHMLGLQPNEDQLSQRPPEYSDSCHLMRVLYPMVFYRYKHIVRALEKLRAVR